MINKLREDWRTVANMADQFGINAGGGVALWDLPHAFSRAFNPILVTRTRYYFATDGYRPTRGPRPNSASLRPGTKRDIILTYPADEAVYVCITTGRGARTVLFTPGTQVQTASGDVVSIDGFKDEKADSPVQKIYKTPEFTFVAQGTEFEDANYIVAENGAVLYVVDDVDTSYLDVYRNGAVGAQLAADSYKGVSIFDLSPVVRLWFAPQLADLQAPGPAPDGRLFVKYALHGIGGLGTVYDFITINAVAQIGASSDMRSYRGQPLTKRRRFPLYAGFPLDFAALDERNSSYSEGVLRYPVPGAGEDENIVDDFGLEIVPTCRPPHPFYVRWINADGGTEYFMFGRRQTETTAVNGTSLYEVPVPDPEHAVSNRRPYGITTENTVTVGATAVPEEEYRILQGLPFAPSIEWYSGGLDAGDRWFGGRWTGITVSKFGGKHDTSNATHDIEVTFQLPALNTQF